MNRFYDKLRLIKEINEDMPVIKCDNVVEYIEKLPKPLKTEFGDARKFEHNNFPCVIPPFARCFMESSSKDMERFGAEIITSEKIAAMNIWVEISNNVMLLPLTNVWSWDESGKLISDRLLSIKHDGTKILKTTEIDHTMKEFNIIYDAIAIAIYTSISFMHCKNVIATEHNPKDIKHKKPIRDSKGHLKKKTPQTKYYTLDIEPMKKILKSEGNIDEVGLQRALHICRGHFKDYSKGNGLFGKYKGLYWWDSTVRGNEESGKIEKDYNIKL